MELYWNDELLSTNTNKEELDSALTRLKNAREATLELRRNEHTLMRVVSLDSRGRICRFLEYWRGEHCLGMPLLFGEWEEIDSGLHGYLDGKLPEEFQEAILEPDCPICAMLARQTGLEAESWAKWN
ncbi:MAG: hypothetical protein A2X36_00625 [Elusimicrobia bacterium GWA2_69_24]|nr:MAG: hypothetical protein A2X36_00625 [Elusimicrobia bacterium GWA2_69_24]HBL16984.1 hypothetical protein [Elusimicrobiota bacterium]